MLKGWPSTCMTATFVLRCDRGPSQDHDLFTRTSPLIDSRATTGPSAGGLPSQLRLEPSRCIPPRGFHVTTIPTTIPTGQVDSRGGGHRSPSREQQRYVQKHTAHGSAVESAAAVALSSLFVRRYSSRGNMRMSCTATSPPATRQQCAMQFQSFTAPPHTSVVFARLLYFGTFTTCKCPAAAAPFMANRLHPPSGRCSSRNWTICTHARKLRHVVMTMYRCGNTGMVGRHTGHLKRMRRSLFADVTSTGSFSRPLAAHDSMP